MRHMSRNTMVTIALTAAASAFAVGCATSAPLKTETSTSGIRAAQEAGAANVPRAALHVQLAKEELERARKLAAEGEKEMAASLLLRAEADAELALALAREDSEQSEAQAAMERVRQLRQDNP